jgi:hypothetical protein
MVLHRAPPSIPDPELSPFGAHPQIIISPYRNEIWDFWYGYGVEINAAPGTMLEFLRDTGVRWTREFQLCDYDVRTYYNYPPEWRDYYWPPSEYWDNPPYVPPVLSEYAELLASLGMKTAPTFAARKSWGPYNSYYADYVQEMVAEYGPLGVDCAELFNEENMEGGFSAGYYADWMRVARTNIDAVDPDFRLAVPATTYADTEYINTVLADLDNEVYGYDLVDAVTYHRYLKSYDTFPWNLLTDQGRRTCVHRAPEDAYIRPTDGVPQSSEWEMILMSGAIAPGLPGHQPLQKPAGLGGGPVAQPVWDTEWAPWAPVVRSDQPFVEGTTNELYGGMSGSLRLGRRMAARSTRQFLCSLEHRTMRLFSWDAIQGYQHAGFRWFEGDCTPTVTPAAMAELTHMLEGYDLADVVTVTELPDNNVNPYYTRTQFYLERAPQDPDDRRAVAVLWNWADDQFDYVEGSGVVDLDPVPSPDPTLIPNLPIDPARVVVSDFLGRTLTFSGPQITDLVLDHEPKFIKTLPGVPLAELMLALDSVRPAAPTKPFIMYNEQTGEVTIQLIAPGAPDIELYRCWREDIVTGAVDPVGESPMPGFVDRPPDGYWRWSLSAIEEFTEYETPRGPASNPLAVPPCRCPSDLNKDDFRNGLDVQGFIDCLLADGVDCGCADLNTDGVFDEQDIDAFVGDLLAGPECP